MQSGQNQEGLTRRREGRELNVEELSAVVVDAAFHLHRDLGPGLLDSVYGAVLERLLRNRGLQVARQVPVPIEFAGVRLEDGFRADLVVEERLVVELKSVEQLALDATSIEAVDQFRFGHVQGRNQAHRESSP